MYVRLNVDIDEKTLEAMKSNALLLTLQANTAIEAYKNAVKEYWTGLLSERIGGEPKEDKPVECVLIKGNKRELIKVVDVTSCSDGSAFMWFHGKTKVGKYRKSSFGRELNHELLYCLRDVNYDARSIEKARLRNEATSEELRNDLKTLFSGL